MITYGTSRPRQSLPEEKIIRSNVRARRHAVCGGSDTKMGKVVSIEGRGGLGKKKSCRHASGAPVLPCMCPCVARGGREPWRSPGARAEECERRRSAARLRERIAGAGDLDLARAWMRSLAPPAPGAAVAATPGMGGTCARRQRTDLFGEDGARCAGRGQRLPGTALIDDPMLAHVPH